MGGSWRSGAGVVIANARAARVGVERKTPLSCASPANRSGFNRPRALYIQRALGAAGLGHVALPNTPLVRWEALGGRLYPVMA